MDLVPGACKCVTRPKETFLVILKCHQEEGLLVCVANTEFAKVARRFNHADVRVVETGSGVDTGRM